MTRLRSALDVFTRGWLWIGLILMPILAHAGGLGFQPFAFLLGVGGWLIIAANWREAGFLKGLWLPFFLGFTSWAWFATLWSPHADDLLLGNAVKLVVFALALVPLPMVFQRLSPQNRTLIGHALMAGTVLAAGLMLFDVMSGYSLSILVDPIRADSNIYIRQGEAERALGRGLATYSQLVWPAIILMLISFKRAWVLALAVLAAFCAAAILNRLSLTIPTLAVTTVFVALAWYKPRLGLTLAFIVAIASLVLAPLIGLISASLDESALRQLPLSWEHRVRMWAYVWDRIQENWFIGNGFDVSRTYQETFASRDGRNIVIVSLHPHNVGLQIWLETGLVGVCLAVGFLASLWRPAVKACASPARAAALTGVIIATTLTAALTIGAWQYWWWGVIALGVVLVLLLPHKN